MGRTNADVKEPSEQHNRLADGAEIPPGAAVERSPDGSVTVVATEEEGVSIHVDPDSEMGREMQRKGAIESTHPGWYINAAIQDALDDDFESVTEQLF